MTKVRAVYIHKVTIYPFYVNPPPVHLTVLLFRIQTNGVMSVTEARPKYKKNVFALLKTTKLVFEIDSSDEGHSTILDQTLIVCQSKLLGTNLNK
jgi:hypothetical protein